MKNKNGQFAFSEHPVYDHAAQKVYTGQQEQHFKPGSIVDVRSGSFRSEIIFYKGSRCNADSQRCKDQTHEAERNKNMQEFFQRM